MNSRSGRMKMKSMDFRNSQFGWRPRAESYRQRYQDSNDSFRSLESQFLVLSYDLVEKFLSGIRIPSPHPFRILKF